VAMTWSERERAGYSISQRQNALMAMLVTQN
jgi:hypothetical protein